MIKNTVLVTDPKPPDLARAVEILTAAGLVAFPTETVYGLGARADDGQAIAAIYAAKNRPTGNPLIVHCASSADAEACASHWPKSASALAAAFWPGPLTLVVQRARHLPDALATGRDTVAVRCPAHPLAQALLKAAPFPIAAPSANPAGRLSPVTAQHVQEHLAGRIDMVLDGGPCAYGIESTVVDTTGEHPKILRPGSINAAALRAVCADVTEFQLPDQQQADQPNHPQVAPGQALTHYAPRAELQLIAPDEVTLWARNTQASKRPFGLILRESSELEHRSLLDSLPHAALPNHASGYAAGLFHALHHLDSALAPDGLIGVVTVPTDDAWLAIRDRLLRAASSPTHSP